MQGTSEGTPTAVFDDVFLQNPYPAYARLREQASAHQVITAMGLKTWVVTRYEEARALLVDPRLSKDMSNAGELFERHLLAPDKRRDVSRELMRHMLNTDPPDHTRLRRLVGKAFTSRRIEQLRPRIEQITDDLLDTVTPGQRIDLLDVLAFPLAITTICELLGVPHADRDDFRAWSSPLVNSGFSQQQMRDAGASMTGYLTRLVADKRAGSGDDMLTALVEASDNSDRLDQHELTSMAFLLLVAGHETTVNLIGNSVLALLEAPDQLAMLRATPTLLPDAIEELLRYCGPLNVATFRFTTEPVQVGAVSIPAGEFVLVSLAAADRDPARFADPERLDLTRPAGGHLAFGHGIHYCLGAPLARIEIEVAMRKLLERFPRWQLAAAPGSLRWRYSTLIRGLEQLSVRLS